MLQPVSRQLCRSMFRKAVPQVCMLRVPAIELQRLGQTGCGDQRARILCASSLQEAMRDVLQPAGAA